MQRIHIDKIQDGHILAKPVKDNFGNVILNAGFVLSSAWTARLKLRKVEYIFVDDSDNEQDDIAVSKEDKLKLASEISEQIDNIFANVMDDERMQYLAEAAKRFHLKKELHNS